MLNNLFKILVFFIFSTTIASAHGSAHLGEIQFPTSGKPVAQTDFIEGVKWLHSFEYPEARAAFQRAQALDPHFALAYWGEAMTYNHPLWSEQDKTAALRVLNKFAATDTERVANASTVREKGLMHAVNTLYGSGDKKARDIAYAEIMRELYRQFPNDDEIASFYALALLGATEGERDFQHYMRAAGIAEDIFSRNPCHPGAIHYAIHSYDDPIHAPLGLRAARMYAKMAPDASHALHMPSHIFLALGMWEDVIASNKAAWSARHKEVTLDDLHAAQWLNYGYLQLKQYDQAYRLTKTVEAIALKSPSPMVRWYYTLMRASYINESQQWQADLRSLTLPNLELSARATDFYINAMIALKKNDIAHAKQLRVQLRDMVTSSKPDQDAAQDYFVAVLPSGIAAAKIMLLELDAALSPQKASSLLNQAAQLEEKTPFGYGPPIPVQPSYELLAQYLLQQKNAVAAYQAYVTSLKRTPQREQSVQGIKNASAALKASGAPIPEIIHPYFNKLMLPDYYQ